MFENQMQVFKGTPLAGFYAGYAAPYDIMRADLENTSRSLLNEERRFDIDEKYKDSPVNEVIRANKLSDAEDTRSRWQSGQLGDLRNSGLNAERATNELKTETAKLESVVAKGHYWIAADQYLGNSAPGDLEAWKVFSADAKKNGVNLPDNPWEASARADIKRRADVAINVLPQLQKSQLMGQQHEQKLGEIGYQAGWQRSLQGQEQEFRAGQSVLDRQSRERIASINASDNGGGGGGGALTTNKQAAADLKIIGEAINKGEMPPLDSLLRVEQATRLQVYKMLQQDPQNRMAAVEAMSGNEQARKSLEPIVEQIGGDQYRIVKQLKDKAMASRNSSTAPGAAPQSGSPAAIKALEDKYNLNTPKK